MLKDYRRLAESLREYFLNKNDWNDIKFDEEAKSILKNLDSIKSVNSYSINVESGSDNHVILPSQYVLYAIYLKELAIAVYEHLEVIEVAKKNYSPELLFNLSKNQKIPEIDGLDDYSQLIALKPIYDKSFNFGGKSFINYRNGKYIYRSLSDFFTSIILQVINVPNASSSILGHFIYDLCQNIELYEKLEDKYLTEIEALVSEKKINNYVYRILSFIDTWDSLDKLLDHLVANEDKRYLSIHFKEIKLVSIFQISDKVLQSEDVIRGGKERFFLEPIKQENGSYLYLSTEWTYKKDSRLDLDNLISIINEIYDLATIVKEERFILTKQKHYSYFKGKELSIILFHEFLDESGVIFNNNLTSRLVTSLTTKPFVIFTGLSGSGKTKLAQAFSKWLIEEEKQLNLVPVGADWTNREPLLGYPNALEDDKYVLPESGVLQLILNAGKDQERPYFLILDEMNLSHVERYFADFLSGIESKEKIKLHSGSKPWEADGYQIPPTLTIPENLFIIGTVNIDETTYMFSPKVLDRANVIEFRVSKKDLSSFLNNPAEVDLSLLEGKGAVMAQDFVKIATSKAPEYSNKEDLSEQLLLFFDELSDVGAEFGYRTAFEINRFARLAEKLSDDWKFEEIMDAAIAQKLLPKLHGSRRKLEKVLFKLGQLCLIEGDAEELLKNPDTIDWNKVKYQISFEKIMRMHKGLVDNGFTSFAEA